MKIHLLLSLVFLAVAAMAGPNPYDEKADAKADVQRALAEAGAANVPVILVFGANWCPDCRALDLAMKTGASGELIAKNFKVVKVNLGGRGKEHGTFEENADLAKSYGVTLDKGIPTVVIVSAQGKLLYATREGELEDARHMGDQGIYDFFKRVTVEVTGKK